jgi:hypothetical protein
VPRSAANTPRGPFRRAEWSPRGISAGASAHRVQDCALASALSRRRRRARFASGRRSVSDPRAAGNARLGDDRRRARSPGSW